MAVRQLPIPTELLADIVDRLADNPATLARLSLVSRQFEAVATPRLYHALTLGDDFRITDFIRHMISNPHLASMVQSLDLSWEWHADEDPENMWEEPNYPDANECLDLLVEFQWSPWDKCIPASVAGLCKDLFSKMSGDPEPEYAEVMASVRDLLVSILLALCGNVTSLCLNYKHMTATTSPATHSVLRSMTRLYDLRYDTRGVEHSNRDLFHDTRRLEILGGNFNWVVPSLSSSMHHGNMTAANLRCLVMTQMTIHNEDGMGRLLRCCPRLNHLYLHWVLGATSEQLDWAGIGRALRTGGTELVHLNLHSSSASGMFDEQSSLDIIGTLQPLTVLKSLALPLRALLGPLDTSRVALDDILPLSIRTLRALCYSPPSQDHLGLPRDQDTRIAYLTTQFSQARDGRVQIRTGTNGEFMNTYSDWVG